jgi:hypothetical protein
MARSYTFSNEPMNPFSDSNFTALFNELYPPLCLYCLNLVGEKEIADKLNISVKK